MVNESSDKQKGLSSNRFRRDSIWSRFGSLALGSLFKTIESYNKEENRNEATFHESKSVLDESVEITKERYLKDFTNEGEQEFETLGKLKIFKPGNYVIIFYAKTDSTSNVKTLNKFYEISKEELYETYPYQVILNKDFFKEGQKLLYQKFGEAAKGYALDYSKVGVGRIYNEEFSTQEVEFSTDGSKGPLTYSPTVFQ